VAIVVPSQGERWKQVESKDTYGRKETTTVHTLGDSVIRVKERFYLSAADETGLSRLPRSCDYGFRPHLDS
jgi:hypothetical protein